MLVALLAVVVVANQKRLQLREKILICIAIAIVCGYFS